jgi:NhaA family Na+:H+ antiporter
VGQWTAGRLLHVRLRDRVCHQRHRHDAVFCADHARGDRSNGAGRDPLQLAPPGADGHRRHRGRGGGRRASAARGGRAAPATAYAGCLYGRDEGSLLAAGWPVVCATDVAFSYCIARSVCTTRGLPFLLLAGVVSNAIALVALEIAHPVHDVHSGGAALVMAAVVCALVMRRCDVRNFWPYLAGPGLMSWWGLYMTGLHPALALVPVMPFLPRPARTRHLMTDAPPGARDALNRCYRTLKYPTHVALFLFGLVNAGVALRGFGTGTWAIAFAALIGKPAGALIALVVAVRAGLHLPRFVGWREMTVLTMASSTGFTFALFFATVAYPVGPILAEIKLGALATGAAAALAVAAAWTLGVGRYAPRRRRRRPFVVAQYAGV